MKIEINTNNCREGILTTAPDTLTIISDQEISAGDTLDHPVYLSKRIELVVDEVLEERPSVGQWKTMPPPGMAQNQVS
jgi:hypothetical protein